MRHVVKPQVLFFDVADFYVMTITCMLKCLGGDTTVKGKNVKVLTRRA